MFQGTTSPLRLRRVVKYAQQMLEKDGSRSRELIHQGASRLRGQVIEIKRECHREIWRLWRRHPLLLRPCTFPRNSEALHLRKPYQKDREMKSGRTHSSPSRQGQ